MKAKLEKKQNLRESLNRALYDPALPPIRKQRKSRSNYISDKSPEQAI